MKKETKKNEQISLTVEPRSIVGKKVRKLRKEGMLPANIYGTDFKSTAISVKYADFAKVYKIVRETGIVYLHLESKEIPTMIKHIQRHPLDSTALHVDFRKVDLTKKIEAEVPVKTVGVSEAVAQKGGVLLTQLSHLKVEALPQDIPQSIDVDIAVLKDIGNEIKVSDLPKSGTYTVTTEADRVVVSVTAHKEESIVAETTAAAAPEVLTAKAPAEGEAVEGDATTKQTAPEGDKKEPTEAPVKK